VAVSPREPGALERPAVTFQYNECNEASDSARDVIETARRLAMVAKGAVSSGDAHRARKTLDQLRSVLASYGIGGSVVVKDGSGSGKS